MSGHLQRGLAFLGMRRPEEALRSFGDALAENPNDAYALAGVAACHLVGERWDAAAKSAQDSIAADPTNDWPHRTLALVALHRRNWEEASRHAEDALQLDPQDSDAHALVARVHIECNRGREALASAEAGLAADPENADCANLRSLALLGLGRRDDAAAAAKETLRFAANDSASHAMRGYTSLHEGDPRGAGEHFAEALRLDPSNEGAREGLIVALRASYAPFRVWLACQLWFARLSSGQRFGIILGGFIGARVLRSAGRQNPALMPWITPVLVVYFLAVYTTWVADPLGNILLLVHPVGRHALTLGKRREAILVGLFIATGIGFAAFWLASDRDEVFLVAVAALVLPFIIVAWHGRDAGSVTRKMMGFASLVLIASAIVGATLLLSLPQEENSLAHLLGIVALGVAIVGSGISTWVSLGLSAWEGRRR